jgi:excinuclease UvrABC nuclease subunit
MELSNLHYHYRDRHKLPRSPGIYILEEQQSFRLGWKARYVGQSTSLWHRWTNNGDREHKHLPLWRRNQSTMRLIVAPCWKANLDYREAVLIKRLKPDLNILRPAPRYTLMVLAEDCWNGVPLAIAMAIALRFLVH